MKVLTFRVGLVAALAGVAVFVGRRRGHWEHEITAISQLLVSPKDVVESEPLQKWEDLPPIVQDYFRFVFSERGTSSSETPFHPPPFSIQSVRLRQTGLFEVKRNQWLPFKARQTIRTTKNSPGFVWDATVQTHRYQGWLHSWLPMPVIKVCDAWVEGKGRLRASLQGAFSLISDKNFAGHEAELAVGEMLRWLTESFLVPTILLPQAGVVTWKAVPDHKNKAILSMVDPWSDKTFSMTVTFDENEIEVKGTRPSAEGNSFVSRTWVGWLSDFKRISHMWIPTHMEGGWLNDTTEAVDIYFRGDNTDMEFSMVLLDNSRADATTSEL